MQMKLRERKRERFEVCVVKSDGKEKIQDCAFLKPLLDAFDTLESKTFRISFSKLPIEYTKTTD